MATTDPAVQEALLHHPEVQAAIKKAGQNALADPEVQKQIVTTAKQNFPQVAEQISTQVMTWAEDPDVQAKAMAYAGVLAHEIRGGATRANTQILALIEQGPTGIRFLSFLGGVAQSVLSFMALFGHFFSLGMIFSPIDFGLCFYQFFFGLSVAIFEMPPWMVESISMADDWQEIICEQCVFMTHTRGRGFFYGFLSSLWLYQSACDFGPVGLLVGIYLGLIAVIHFLLSMGFTGLEIAQKIRRKEREMLDVLKGDSEDSGNAREVELADRRQSGSAPLLPP